MGEHLGVDGVGQTNRNETMANGLTSAVRWFSFDSYPFLSPQSANFMDPWLAGAMGRE